LHVVAFEPTDGEWASGHLNSGERISRDDEFDYYSVDGRVERLHRLQDDFSETMCYNGWTISSEIVFREGPWVVRECAVSKGEIQGVAPKHVRTPVADDLDVRKAVVDLTRRYAHVPLNTTEAQDREALANGVAMIGQDQKIATTEPTLVKLNDDAWWWTRRLLARHHGVARSTAEYKKGLGRNPPWLLIALVLGLVVVSIVITAAALGRYRTNHPGEYVGAMTVAAVLTVMMEMAAGVALVECLRRKSLRDQAAMDSKPMT
jgi:hypothetical protein